jgi:cytochrome b561
MQKRASTYDKVTVLLHWTIGIGILAIGMIEIMRHEFPKGTLIREGLKPLHQPAGTILFALIMVRIMWRATFGTTIDTAKRMTASATAAKLTHLALYAMMVALPLLGMLSMFARGKPIDFGLFQLVMPLGDLIGSYAGLLKSTHEAFGYGILLLAFVHAAAALGHHYVLKDDVLLRMRFPRSRRVAGLRSGSAAAADAGVGSRTLVSA